MKPRAPPLLPTRLLGQVRERIRYMHYSLATEKVYLYWVRFFVRWSGRNSANGQMRHPRDIDAKGVAAFLTMLATKRHVSAPTQFQALGAIPIHYRAVLAIDLPPAPAECACLTPVAWHRLQDVSCAKIYA